MRAWIPGVLALAVAAGAGCSSGASKQGGATPARSAAQNCVMRADGREVLKLTIPLDATCTARHGSIRAESHDRDVVDIWLVSGAKTVDDGAARIAEVIAQEFKSFRASSGTEVPTIGGSAANRVRGTGVEADDGDPGTADVIVFRAGDRVFVACTHGESLNESARQWMTTVVKTATAP